MKVVQLTEELIVNGKSVFLFDNVLETYQIEELNILTFNSKYAPLHGTSMFTPEQDERFVSYLTAQIFNSSPLEPLVKKIANALQKDLAVSSCYINHYSQMAKVGQHTDSAFEDAFTILVFVNYFWQSNWGGEIKFFNEESQHHYCYEFVPGRVIVFDSRIEHAVMPLTAHARKDRFSIAIKAVSGSNINPGQQYVSKIRYERG